MENYLKNIFLNKKIFPLPLDMISNVWMAGLCLYLSRYLCQLELCYEINFTVGKAAL